ncbi:hypothetical protein P4O66_004604 [Electrophorus voltai]|uniref:Uncharacterized protein n=1 Tax=Electrophorus voltai TaxID=2609070 RepID=A0AAD8ZQ72_9TELE|nr:hypothetical protein P4O66_004604 [Electrophorus voltai]
MWCGASAGQSWAEVPSTEGLTTEGLTMEGPRTEGLSTEGLTMEGPSTEALTAEGQSTEGPSTEGLTVEDEIDFDPCDNKVRWKNSEKDRMGERGRETGGRGRESEIQSTRSLSPRGGRQAEVEQAAVPGSLAPAPACRAASTEGLTSATGATGRVGEEKEEEEEEEEEEAARERWAGREGGIRKKIKINEGRKGRKKEGSRSPPVLFASPAVQG